MLGSGVGAPLSFLRGPEYKQNQGQVLGDKWDSPSPISFPGVKAGHRYSSEEISLTAQTQDLSLLMRGGGSDSLGAPQNQSPSDCTGPPQLG